MKSSQYHRNWGYIGLFLLSGNIAVGINIMVRDPHPSLWMSILGILVASSIVFSAHNDEVLATQALSEEG